MTHDPFPRLARTTHLAPTAATHWQAAPEMASPAWRNVAKLAVAFVFLMVLAATLTSLTLFQATSEGAAKRTHRRAVAALSEIDPLIDRNWDALQQQATSAAPGGQLQLADYPLDVPLTRDEVLNSSRAQLRDLLLDRSANLMYSRGTGALRSTPGSSSGVGMFTVGGLTDNGLGFLTRRHHDILGVLTFVLAATSVILAIALAALCRGFGRLASVGAVVVAASTPTLLAGLGARLYIRAISGSENDYVRQEFLAIGRGLAWIPIRNGIAFSVLGAAFLVIGISCALWTDRRDTTRVGVERTLVR
jgi:hypothetical protein